MSDGWNGGQATGPGWFPDPLGRYDHRWFNGSAWTADVSVDGQRYVDPLPLEFSTSRPPGPGPVAAGPPPTGRPGTQPPYGTPPPYGSTPAGMPVPGAPYGWSPYPGAKRPTRTMAVLAFIGGLVSIATGWIPFVFVLGVAAGVTGLVLGIVARRRVRRGEAQGGGLATAAIVLSPIGLALCVVGAIWSVSAYREFLRYVEPGPVSAEVTQCTVDGPGVRIAGTVENLSGQVRSYTLVIDVYDGTRRVERTSVEVDDVASRTVERWEDLAIVRDDIVDLRCEIDAVNGPFPFGIDPEA